MQAGSTGAVGNVLLRMDEGGVLKTQKNTAKHRVIGRGEIQSA
jgi:hypothetical protein